ncbi:acyl-CoA desaturase [Cumulibacter manganitolerans]|uniref:acyl-CoA desaturase n=1 Tax=Cumulibacter manganitolerans TaxID=1884992 RepID=UPI0012953962|nr:acyl-CoA desaturase [Cumulibacter manganitolerans]
MTPPTATAPPRQADKAIVSGPVSDDGKPKPIVGRRKALYEHVLLYVFVLLPLAAMLVAVPLAAGGGWLSWTDVVLFAVFYVLGVLGVTVGYHRHFTHGSFKAKQPLRVALAIAGSMAIQGSVIQWVADHRRHHAYSDRDGDPHSPWRYGHSAGALVKGLFWAHMGWMFQGEKTNKERFTPDLLKDRQIRFVSNTFGLWAAISLLLPPLIGGLVAGSWHGALTAFFWASLVRVGAIHHMTWSINSICHALGERPFSSRDMSSNYWPLAILSMGEAWHNLHHADPTAARHGVMRGQLDISARVIWIFERLGWAYNVKWPSPERVQAKLAEA